MKADYRQNEGAHPSACALLSPRPSGSTETPAGGLKIAAVSCNAETIRNLGDLLRTEDSAIQFDVWAIGWPGGATQLAAMLERGRPNVLLLDAQAGNANDLPELERIVARYPEMTVLLIGVRHQPEFVLVAIEKRMHQLSCIKWRRCDLQSHAEADDKKLPH